MSTYSFRITTNGVLRNYRSNLYKSYNTLNTCMTRLQTHREYNSYAEDPATANLAFQLRRSIWRANDQLNNTNNTIAIYDCAFSAMDSICDGNDSHPGFDSIKEDLNVLNGPTGDGRVPLGQTLLSTADSIVQAMNSQSSGNFVFAGADGHNVPFTWGENANGTKVLLYRGIDVSTPSPEKVQKDFAEEIEADKIAKEVDATKEKNAKVVEDIKDTADPTKKLGEKVIVYTKDSNGDTVATPAERLYATNADGSFTADPPVWDENADGTVKYINEGDPEVILSPDHACEEKYGMTVEKAEEDYKEIQKILGEHTYVDIGLGFEEDADGNVIPTSAYDTCLHGLEILGWGVDEDGDSRNMVTLMRELGEIAQRCNAEDGAFQEGDEERANVLTRKLRTALDKVSEQHVKLTAETKYLYSNAEILTDSRDALDSQRADLEQVKPALAIEEMSWANYSYNAALKIGNTILSQSLIDYMN